MVVRIAVAAAIGLCLFGPAHAEEPVHFADLTLKMMVENQLGMMDPTPTDMLGLTSLQATSRNISSLTGLQYATNLHVLNLARNQISDVSLLSGLVGLQKLILNNNQISDISALSSLTGLTYLDIHENRITGISSLAGLSDLRYLDLHDNQVSNISPLSGLRNLETVILRINGIRDISPLAALSHLTTVYLEYNRIRDVSALSSLANLRDLNLYSNEVTDLSPLTSLRSLASLDLRANPSSEESCEVYVPQIVAQNPGLHILHNCGPFVVSISSTAGGSVVDPGEGRFTYSYGQTVCLEAKADPCFVFVAWSGTNTDSQNPATIVVRGDQDIRANFISTLGTIHVDDNASGDPGLNDPRVSDPRENGTRERPFDGIQEAIDVAADGATIFVHGGTYPGSIDFRGKDIELTGFDPEDANAAGWPIIIGESGPVVTFSRGESQDCILAGVVLTGGKDHLAGAILCSGSSPTIANCLIAGNRVTDPQGATVYCKDSNAVFVNCTIADNQAGKYCAAVYLLNARVTVVNSILWGNTPKEILFDDEYTPPVRFTTVAGGWPGQGNLKGDPLFASAGYWTNQDKPDAIWTLGDYHLQSQAGRWDPTAGTWVCDAKTTPCIDSGAPSTPVGREPPPNGGIINMGVYGGTPEASRSASNGSSP